MAYANDPYKIHDVQTKQLVIFDRGNNAHRVTQVTIYVGDQGPFTATFGPGQDMPDDLPSINQWKVDTVNKVRAICGA